MINSTHHHKLSIAKNKIQAALFDAITTTITIITYLTQSSHHTDSSLTYEMTPFLLVQLYYPYIIYSLLALILLYLLNHSFLQVRTNEIVCVERLGQFSRTLKAGLHFIVPFVEQVKWVRWVHTVENPFSHKTELKVEEMYRIPTQEILFDFPTLNVTTKDRIAADVNGIMFFRIQNPVKAVYEICDLYQSIEQLIYTSLRDAISKITLDEAIEGKSKIKDSIAEDFKSLEESWGVKLTKFDIQSIEAPSSIAKSIEKLVAAQREAQAELEKTRSLQQAKLLKIQTEQEIELLACDTANKKKLNDAQTETEIAKQKAESESLAIRMKAESEALYLSKILSVKGIDQSYLIQKEYTQAVRHLSQSSNKVIVIPMESAKYFGMTSTWNASTLESATLPKATMDDVE
ncbi:hypothetical protein FDP41_006937 [Naegleria fowleri]|uniref:Band 7 domain-containing protein n=1 Tax=Naegleria fowleri TaxID=5763 RepID=A0A6A5BAW6_NAEFO|nr:uncharacterized protein FDP41_006937 [Naegleria fowleri]KAF0974327.1 hypothetical protein FDP41_006937 [Naegleria fowleri]